MHIYIKKNIKHQSTWETQKNVIGNMIMKEWIKMKLEKKVRHDESKTKILREQQHNDASQSMVGES